MAASFDADRLAEMWTSVSDSDVFRARRDIWRLPRPQGLWERRSLAGRLLAKIGWTWYFDTTPLPCTLVDMLGAERLPVRDVLVAVVSAVEKATGELMRFRGLAVTDSGAGTGPRPSWSPRSSRRHTRRAGRYRSLSAAAVDPYLG